jgi:hypothetical protein
MSKSKHPGGQARSIATLPWVIKITLQVIGQQIKGTPNTSTFDVPVICCRTTANTSGCPLSTTQVTAALSAARLFLSTAIKGKVAVQFALEQATKAQSGSTGIAILFL